VEEASPEFRTQRFFRAIWMAIFVGILFYATIVTAVAFVAQWRSLVDQKFMTAVAFRQAVGSRWIVNVILAAALLSLVKCFNGNFVAASRLFFALGRRGMVDPRIGSIHAQHQTPSTAVLCIGFATAACMLLGDAILVPVTEVRDLRRLPCSAALQAGSYDSIGERTRHRLVRSGGWNCHGVDETSPICTGTLHRVRMDRAGSVDRVRRGSCNFQINQRAGYDFGRAVTATNDYGQY
jgi:hypothetical protein